jgi:hypothetical protein
VLKTADGENENTIENQRVSFPGQSMSLIAEDRNDRYGRKLCSP